MTTPKLPRVHITEVYEEEGRLYERALGAMICDFCGDLSPVWDYDCADFEFDHPGFPPGGSHGGWLACERCGELIESGDVDELANRAMFSSGAATWEKHRTALTLFHGKFFAHKYGERRRWGAG